VTETPTTAPPVVPLDDLADDLETYRLAKAEIAKWKSVQEAAARKIQERLGDAVEGTIDGHKVVSWGWRYPERVDVKKLREKLGDELLRAQGFLKVNPQGERRFEVED
jgi:hypothetical protein